MLSLLAIASPIEIERSTGDAQCQDNCQKSTAKMQDLSWFWSYSQLSSHTKAKTMLDHANRVMTRCMITDNGFF